MSSLVPQASISHNCLEPQRVCSTLKSPVTEKFFECLKSQFKPWRTTDRGDGYLAGLDTGVVALVKFGFANVGNKRSRQTMDKRRELSDVYGLNKFIVFYVLSNLSLLRIMDVCVRFSAASNSYKIPIVTPTERQTPTVSMRLKTFAHVMRVVRVPFILRHSFPYQQTGYRIFLLFLVRQ